jgi:hypothetical protein
MNRPERIARELEALAADDTLSADERNRRAGLLLRGLGPDELGQVPGLLRSAEEVARDPVRKGRPMNLERVARALCGLYDNPALSEEERWRRVSYVLGHLTGGQEESVLGLLFTPPPVERFEVSPRALEMLGRFLRTNPRHMRFCYDWGRFLRDAEGADGVGVGLVVAGREALLLCKVVVEGYADRPPVYLALTAADVPDLTTLVGGPSHLRRTFEDALRECGFTPPGDPEDN